MTKEDHVELIKTHTFIRKHATGTAKIELHILHVERGNSFVYIIDVQGSRFAPSNFEILDLTPLILLKIKSLDVPG